MSKDILLVICLLIAAGSIAFGVRAVEKENRISKSLDEERYTRMVAEESSQKSAAKVEILENQLKSSEEKMAKLKDLINQEKGVNSDLKNQYDKLSQTKSDLEAKLKAVLDEKSMPAPVAQAATAPAPTVTANQAAAGTAK